MVRGLGVRVRLGEAVLCLAFIVSIGGARPARACMEPFEPGLRTIPAADTADVPTDVQPVIDLAALGVGSVDGVEVELTSGAAGPVEIEVTQPYVWHAVVRPRLPLAADTAHVLTVAWTYGEDAPQFASMTFRTGAGPLAMPPQVPSGSLEHFQAHFDQPNSCSPPDAGTCVALDDAAVVVASHVDWFDQSHEAYLYAGSFMTNLSGIDQRTPFTCVDVRVRALNGDVSDPLRLCGADAPLQQLWDPTAIGCDTTGLVHDGENMSTQAGEPDFGDEAEPVATAGVSGSSEGSCVGEACPSAVGSTGAPDAVTGPEGEALAVDAMVVLAHDGGAQAREGGDKSDSSHAAGAGCSVRAPIASGFVFSGGSALLLMLLLWRRRRAI